MFKMVITYPVCLHNSCFWMKPIHWSLTNPAVESFIDVH